ncbi:hypothetical protein Dimus_027718 [Dionaea muscipula]
MKGGGRQIAQLEESGNPCSSRTEFSSEKSKLSLEIKKCRLLNLDKKQKTNTVSSEIGLQQKEVDSCQNQRRKRKLIQEQGFSCESSVKEHTNELGDDLSLSVIPKDDKDVRTKEPKRRKKHEGKKYKVVQDDQSLAVCPKDDEKVESPKLKRSSRKHNPKSNKVVLDEASRLQRRARYLLVKAKLEQNLIDAYSAEGWKGKSREKIRPEKELQRAKKQILKCKLGIRDIVRQLDILSSVGQIEESLIAPDGSVHHDHIYCAKCKLQDVSQDNDIILCDGTCNCAFHQKCLDPPLATENIPPEGQGWLCRYCECKMEILEAMNAHLGTEFSADSSWKDIFNEEASLPDSGTGVLNPEEEWPGDDSEDNDYDPECDENEGCRTIIGDENSDDGSISSSSCCSLDDEIYLESGSPPKQKRTFENSLSINSIGHDSDEQTDHEIISGPRRRDAVDYKKLYDEMFGKDMANCEQLSEDEDWGPPGKRRRKKECDAANTLMALCDSEKKHSDPELQVGKEFPRNLRPRKIRIPVNVVEKLRQVFAENELPTRAVKQNISQELGIEYEKVNKWFKNSRYAALKTRKIEGGKEPHSPSIISKKSNTEATGNRLSKSMEPFRKVKHQKRVSWKANVISLFSPLKQQQQHRRAFLGSPLHTTKCVGELNDDVSLKQLWKLMRKSRKKKSVVFGKRCLVKEAEVQMETVCRIEAKIQNLRQILMEVQSAEADEQNGRCVVYIPIAELKEKARR